MAFSRLPLITGIALVLFSCVQPIDLQGFVDNMPNPPVGVNIHYEVNDESPKLQWSNDGGNWWTELNAKGTVTINLNNPPSPSTVTIQVRDESSFTDITWYCDSSTALTTAQGVQKTNNEWLVITPGTAPFTAAKDYQLVVVGKKDGNSYGTNVSIKVVGNSP
jgi:hypothetical protein